MKSSRRAEILLSLRDYLDRGGCSVLDIRPLLWRDRWPVAGDNFQEGTYEIQPQRKGYALELAADFVPMDRGAPSGPVTPIPAQELSQVAPTLARFDPKSDEARWNFQKP